MNKAKEQDILRHYSSLGLKPGAGVKEIEKAYAEMLELYAEGSPAIYGLYQAGELQQVRMQLEQSYHWLLASLQHSPPDLVSAKAKEPQPSLKRAKRQTPEIDYAKERLDGAFLTRVRKEMGLSLPELSRETRIARNHLEAIEADATQGFSARVYLIGYLKLYARALGLDPKLVCEGYLENVMPKPEVSTEST